MNIAGLQPQIFCSIIVILAAAGIAVMVDCLKRKNEKLREALVELNIRREQERQQLTQSRLNAAVKMTEKAVAEKTVAEEIKLEVPAEKAVAPLEPPVEAAPPQVSEVHDRNIAIRNAEDRATEFASRQGRRRHPGPSPEVLPRPENGTSKEALHEWLSKRAAARATSSPAPGPIAVESERAPAELEASLPDSNGPSVFIDESLWASILGLPGGNEQKVAAAIAETPSPKPQPRFEVIVGSAGIPAGMHEQFTLNRLLESNKSFTGLVISISMHQNDGRAVGKDILLSVNHFVSSLLRDEDFGCQTADDEFLILCPGERGNDAQRRLTEISEGLWDFQLRGLGTFSILFSWGDAQAQDELLSEAVASASERMNQTRRTRKTVSLDSPSPRRRAIAAV